MRVLFKAAVIARKEIYTGADAFTAGQNSIRFWDCPKADSIYSEVELL